MASRQFARLLARRLHSSPKSRTPLKEEYITEEIHAEGTMKTWRNVSAFVAIPAIGICIYNAYKLEQEHHHHPRPDFVEYSHLRIRSKPFPWKDGNHSLFHNPHANALPEGYEDEDDH
ncbi:predicted protein [Nematostella vectensis]|uniref:Cytochrome c oxidase polypeptide VIa n=1 Tax=Nematostella vectensis TaxID=45351 RepID=A7RMA3_NEMVE|nr:cytochrome c oxidase subunit 6A, mitochondrial [Nematostella vectensis]EDO47567.1 predicted protein [Nematostella vectensis]|eukprot:XP_001639630.1 predicted protein [Nematostella vectensis]